MSRFWPRCTWPVRFPEGRSIHARIETTPHMQIAQIQSGQLALEASWLPKAVKLLPVGVYLAYACGSPTRTPRRNARGAMKGTGSRRTHRGGLSRGTDTSCWAQVLLWRHHLVATLPLGYGSRHNEATVGLLTSFALFLNRQTKQVTHQRGGETADLGMIGDESCQRAA